MTTASHSTMHPPSTTFTMASSTPSRRSIAARLLAALLLILLLFGHYSYQNLSASSIPAYHFHPSQPFPQKIWQSSKADPKNSTPQTNNPPHQWRTLNPSFRYERLTDANMDAYVRSRAASTRHIADLAISDLFVSLPNPILKAEFLRYLVLLYDGGVWADIDTLPHRPVAEWIPPVYRDRVNLVVGIEKDGNKQPIWPGLPYSVQLCTYTVLAKPGHPAIRAVVDEVAQNLGRVIGSKAVGGAAAFEEVMSTMGPLVFTRVLMEYLSNTTGIAHTGDELGGLAEPRLIGDILVLPKDSFGWLQQEHRHPKVHEMVLVEHFSIPSWRAGCPG
ncbi:alpha-1 6-mannosyltransferase HOC1 [Podospora aff. communis PSN243]|uniref:Alpha-1 6-mannosyltransferase HOC1 n=1 Tax=Podospora aff. communis PSN243 TaxID=3040156 RepID=A0AAV9GUB7_9PEZI|nr:alpha-1 6-mannosyltransferase HOC1 [Podospora aff. communis PSN243]